jgi:multicomponent Na+:H+ antiporter subunit G
MAAVIDGLSWILLVAGGVFCIVGAVGLLRMPELFTRMHATSIIDTLGVGLIVVGLILQAGWTQVTLKLLVILALYFFTSPLTTHAVARAALHRGVRPVLSDEGDGSSKS